MVRSNDELQRKYHIAPEMNDGVVLSLYTKKPMNFSVKSIDRETRDAQIAEIEADFGYHFRKVVRSMEQVHGCKVAVISEDDLDAEPGPADGLLTDLPGVALEIRTADCQSIFLYDPVRKAVANVHSGWRGTLQGIAVRAVGLMQSEYGCRPADIKKIFLPFEQEYLRPSYIERAGDFLCPDDRPQRLCRSVTCSGPGSKKKGIRNKGKEQL